MLLLATLLACKPEPSADDAPIESPILTDDTGDLPDDVLTRRDCAVVLREDPRQSFTRLQVAGEFNGWTPTDMSGPDEDGYYTASLGELPPGEYGYKLLFDGAWESEPPADVYTKWVDGVENRNLRVGDCQRPLLQTISATANAAGELTVVVLVAAGAGGAPIDPGAVQATLGGEPATVLVDPDTGFVRVTASGLAPGKHSLRLYAADTAGNRAENEPLFIPLWVEDEPFVWSDSLLYFAFVDRFKDGDGAADALPDVASCANYDGGDFLGVKQAIEDGYFESLGVNTLWLSPSLDNAEGRYLGADGVSWFSGYHGYWPIDPLAIEARFGDSAMAADARLHDLIATAHAHGIRVLFDLVLNHVHEDHSYVAEHGQDWFGSGCVCGTEGCGWDDHPVECWFMPYLPDLNYKNHDIVQRVLADTLQLIQTYDVDAVRIDAAKHMDHVIMRSLSMRLRDDFETGDAAPFYLVGETFTGDRGLIMDYVGDTELDGQFDFPLYYAVRDTFIRDASFWSLEGAVDEGQIAYGGAVMSPFIGNHDVQRFATEITGRAGDCWSGWIEDSMAEGGDTVTQWDVINKTAMALAFVLTQPGAPLLYYGDEIGLHGGGDPDNRRMMQFAPNLSANQETLLARVQAVGQARAEHEALRRGRRVQLWVDDDLLIYARDNGGGDAAIVVMNKGDSARTESVPVSALSAEGLTFIDVLGSRFGSTVSGDHLSISVNSWQTLILVPQ